MKTKAITILFCTLFFVGYGQVIEEVFPLKWKTKIGLTSYRTNMVFDEKSGQIIIGSNGDSRDDIGDSKEGVYLIDPNTGEIKQHIYPEHGMDGDVNGVAFDGQNLFFGDDAGYFYAYQNGQKLWEYNLGMGHDSYNSGDIETCPVLTDLNGDGQKDVIFTAENWGIFALNGLDGTEIWKHLSVDGNYKAYGMNSPAVFDVNDDGVEDIIWGTRTDETYKTEEDRWGSYGDWLLALNGENGELLWKYPTYSAINASPIVYTIKRKTYILLAETYSGIHILNTKGKKVASWSGSIPEFGGISAFFSSPVMNDDNKLVIGTSWWGERDGVWVLDFNDLEESEVKRELNFVTANRISASACIVDVDPSKGKEFLIPTENGQLLMFSEKGDLLKELKLPSGAEASVFFGDTNGDKRLELLVAALDGYLYCFETETKNKSRKTEWTSFRGNPSNNGQKK